MPQFFVNHPVYAITVIFICLLSDKASNAELFQIFPCELYHTYSTFRLLSLKTKPTIAYSNPTAFCLSPRLKSTGNNRGETEVFNAVRRGFPEVKLQIDVSHVILTKVSSEVRTADAERVKNFRRAVTSSVQEAKPLRDDITEEQ